MNGKESRELIVKVAFATLGCRTNQNDTAEMQTLLEQEGFSIVGCQEPADIYVVNTCTVTAKSDSRSRLAVKKSLAINDDAMIVLTGCYAQNSPEEATQIPGLDVVLGNANKLEIAEVIKTQLDRLQQKDTFGLPLVHMSDITQKSDRRRSQDAPSRSGPSACSACRQASPRRRRVCRRLRAA